jgi:hypothetical protein
MAGGINLSGSVGLEMRTFIDAPQHAGQQSGQELSLSFEPEFRYRQDNHQFSVIPFFRKTSRDDKRSHFDLREAYWLYLGNDWEILTGVNKVFWGVTESRHLVNIINQIDAVEDLDGEDYLGQPMVNVTSQTDFGRINAYVLPGFRERSFVGTKGRFRGPISVNDNRAEFKSGAAENHVDYALRWSHYFGDWDVGLSHFYGTGREPRLIPNANQTEITPYYDLINQTGLDVQYTNEAWLWKFEGIVREGQGDTFAAATGGFEYTFYQVFNSAADIGVLAEYQYDGRDSTAPLTNADNDIFSGVRLAMNDIQDTAVLAGFSIDPETTETFYNLEAERRFGVNYTAELRARVFSGADVGENSFALEKDSYIQLRMSHHF